MYSDLNAISDIINYLVTHSFIFRMCIYVTFIGIICTLLSRFIWSAMAKRPRRSEKNEKENK